MIRSIHPLCWLLLFYLISSQANNLYLLIVYGPPRGGVSEGSFITGFIVSLVAVIHIGIYDVAFRHQLSRRIQWLVLATQTVLALALIHLSQNPPATVALSFALLVAFLELLRWPLRIFLASFGYLGCLLLYSQTPAAHAIRVFFWQGENTVYEVLSAKRRM